MQRTYVYHKSTASRGFSTIEILIAFGIGMVFLSAALMVVYSDPRMVEQRVLSNSHTITLDTVLDSVALATSTNGLAVTTATVRADWNSDATESNDGFYTNTPKITDISACSKNIEHRTTWDAQHSRSREIRFDTVASAIDIARVIGRDVCDPVPPSSWTAPENPLWKTASGDITGTQTGMSYVRRSGAPYVLVFTASTVQQNDLWVVDVSDTHNPQVVSAVEVGDNFHQRGVLDGVVVHADKMTYAYLLQNSTTSQLVTMDVSDPLRISSPVDTISFDSYGVSANGSNPEGRVITYYSGRLYIGLRTTIGPELLVFDVSENPAHPTFVGAVANTFDHSIYDIAVRDQYAYLAIKPGSPPSGLPTRELIIMDIGSAIPRDTGGGYNATSTTNDTEGGMALYLIGDSLYMGRERVSNVAEKDFYVFDISSSTRPSVIKSRRLGISTGGGFGAPRITDLFVQGSIAFITTTDTVRSFHTYDVMRDSITIVPITNSCSGHLAIERLTEIIYKDNLIYALHGLEPTLSILHDSGSFCAS